MSIPLRIMLTAEQKALIGRAAELEGYDGMCAANLAASGPRVCGVRRKEAPEVTQSDRNLRLGWDMVAQATQLKNMLGNGIYTVPEAALYAKVSTRMMSRWLFGSQQGEAVILPQFRTAEKLVSFLDFVQTLAIKEIRLQKKIPLNKFRQAIALAKQSFKMDYPFARQHCTYLWGEELVIRPPGEGLVEASGRHKGQRLFSFVELYLESLSFNDEGLANLYDIYHDGNVKITMNPRVHFGEPILPSGYSATTLWESVTAEGSLNRAAKVHGVPEEEVQAAYKFFVNHLGRTAA